MASRMDRYYKDELVEHGRSNKNKDLYSRIDYLDEYTNIEAVASIDKTNEIDISKVKEMLKNREGYKRQREIKELIKKEVEPLITTEENNEEKHDIKELLSKINNNSSTIRKLTNDQINSLLSIKTKENKYDFEKEEEEIRELMNTISNSRILNEVKNSDDVGLFDELKSDTMVGTASSIKKIIDEEKKHDTDILNEIDKSFYTSSLGLTKSDFEDLKNENHKIKKSNKFIIILLIILILLIIVALVVFILNK